MTLLILCIFWGGCDLDFSRPMSLDMWWFLILYIIMLLLLWF